MSLFRRAEGILARGRSVHSRVSPAETRSPPRPPGTPVVIGDWSLVSAALGRERATVLLRQLRVAGRTLDPDARDIPGGVEIDCPRAVAAVSELVRSEFSWDAHESILLADASTLTGAVTVQRRRRPWITGGRR